MGSKSARVLVSIRMLKGVASTLHEHGHFHEVDDLDSGDLMFFAGGRKHSQVLLGEGIWCDALS